MGVPCGKVKTKKDKYIDKDQIVENYSAQKGANNGSGVEKDRGFEKG
jgi:hypothetical protein